MTLFFATCILANACWHCGHKFGQPCGTRHSGTIYRQRSRSKSARVVCCAVSLHHLHWPQTWLHANCSFCRDIHTGNAVGCHSRQCERTHSGFSCEHFDLASLDVHFQKWCDPSWDCSRQLVVGMRDGPTISSLEWLDENLCRNNEWVSSHGRTTAETCHDLPRHGCWTRGPWMACPKVGMTTSYGLR